MNEFPKFIESKNDSIVISETFYSIQGEGKYIGSPSVFLRTQGCLLNCNWCDTYNVWKTGKEYSYLELAKLFESNGYFDTLNRGSHLILTGGEPLARQMELMKFVDYIVNCGYVDKDNLIGNIEIETAGTVRPLPSFLSSYYPHYNVSPKLSNSGMDAERRNRQNVMNYFSSISWEINKSIYNADSSFKFVVSNRNDIDEIIQEYLLPYNINPKEVYLMAESRTRKELQERELQSVELAKEYGFKYSTRLHLHIWDKATGV